MNEEAAFTIIARVKVPVFAHRTNYFHVYTDHVPGNRDAIVVGLTLWELWAAKNKDFTFKKVLILFTTKPQPQVKASERGSQRPHRYMHFVHGDILI